MALGFTSSVLFFTLTYFSVDFLPMCMFLFLGALTNAAGNALFNAALMLALPQENRSAILGFINSAVCGGTALSSVIYGFLGDAFPLYLVFAAGSILSLLPMIYLCFHKQTKAFILSHCD
jgi:MFS family permease